MTTGERMKARRKQIGLSAEKVAELLKVSPATVYRYEKGDIEKLPGSILEPLAAILRTTPAYLMGWERAQALTTGERIKESRERLNLTQAQLAERIGATKQNISAFECGAVPHIPYDMIEKIANELHTTPAYLVGWEDASGEIDLVLMAIDIADEYGWNRTEVSDIISSMDSSRDIDKRSVLAEVQKRKAVSTGSISAEARRVACAYDNADPAVQFSVRKLLDIDESSGQTSVVEQEDWHQYEGAPIAARDGGIKPANDIQARHIKCLADDIRRRKKSKDGEDE